MNKEDVFIKIAATTLFASFMCLVFGLVMYDIILTLVSFVIMMTDILILSHYNKKATYKSD